MFTALRQLMRPDLQTAHMRQAMLIGLLFNMLT